MILHNNLDREGSRCIESTDYNYGQCLGTATSNYSLTTYHSPLRDKNIFI